ncbi:MAG TPA: isocitrate dehydrogenase kinase/phosphatase-domain containing protein, partial [Phytomonospora sp.]
VRRIPQAATYEDELSAEPWVSVGENDVFPEEFHAFLVPAGEVRVACLEAHGDLLDGAFWQRVQERLGAGEVVDVFPYQRSELLRRGR